MAVLLARRPEGDVLGAELVVEEFLKCNALINDNTYTIKMIIGVTQYPIITVLSIRT